jgi:hypothetical protein
MTNSTHKLFPPRKGANGFAALLTVVIIGASAFIIAFSSSIIGLGELDMGYTVSGAGEALSIADGCMDEALERLRKESSYTGGNLSYTKGSCMIRVVSMGGIGTVTVTASTTENYYKKIESTVAVSGGNVNVNAWIEKGN